MLELPDPNSVSLVADWVELTVSINGDRVSRASVASDIGLSTGQEPDEGETADIWRELAYRQSLYLRPPFSVGDRTVESLPGAEGRVEYLTCLLLSLYGVHSDNRKPAKLFERLVGEAVSRYLAGKAQVFGWPFDPDEGPAVDGESRIERKVKALASELSEKFSEAPGSRFKDRRLDVVGWIPFAEGRSGQLVILLQCAAGHDWNEKLPVPLEAWCEYIHWACKPVSAFAVPGIICERQWHDVSKERGLLFDRIRITNLLSQGLDDRKLEDDLGDWVRAELSVHGVEPLED